MTVFFIFGWIIPLNCVLMTTMQLLMYSWTKSMRIYCLFLYTEWATYLGQRVFFVVFPQFDPIDMADWTDKSSFTSKASGPVWIFYYCNLAALHLKSSFQACSRSKKRNERITASFISMGIVFVCAMSLSGTGYCSLFG